MRFLNHIQADSGIFRTLAYLHIQVFSAPLNMSFGIVLCKIKKLETWNQKCLIWVALGFKFEKLLPYFKLAPQNQSKFKVPREEKNL